MDNIKTWITDSYENNKKLSFNSCLFISGNSGTGKTFSINKIANELNLFIININSSNCLSSALFNDLLLKSFITSLIQILTSNNSKKIIIIDDYDILLALDNTINISLYNFININTNKLKHIPIICIINNSIIKKIGDIKNKCKFINFPNMNENIIYDIVKSYNPQISFINTLNIIIKTNYNLSTIIKQVSNTYYNNNDEILISDNIYSNNFDRNYLRRIVIKEQWLIPLNFHENLIIELYKNRNCSKKDKELFYKDFLLNFCYFDIIMNKSNEIGIDFFISIIQGLFDISNKKVKKTKLGNFTKMLSYLSLQKKNNKTFYNNKNFPFHYIGNYHLNLINRKFIY